MKKFSFLKNNHFVDIAVLLPQRERLVSSLPMIIDIILKYHINIYYRNMLCFLLVTEPYTEERNNNSVLLCHNVQRCLGRAL